MATTKKRNLTGLNQNLKAPQQKKKNSQSDHSSEETNRKGTPRGGCSSCSSDKR